MHPLVSPAWLFDHLNDPNLVLLDATLPPVGVTPAPDVRAHYLAQHLPGAVFFDIDQLSDPTSGLPHALPTPAAFSRSMAALGIPRDATLVVYEQAAVFSAPRARWMLRTLGAPNVLLLDGGLPAWREAGYPTQSGEVTRPPATFEAILNPAALKHFPEIQQLIADRGQILDARSTPRFDGTAPEPRPGLPSGHMPGATNIPYTSLLEAGRLKTSPQLAELFADSHVDLTRPVTTTCGSGVTAAVVALALELCGAADITLYDGSWAEYAQQPTARIEPEPTA